mmetsp:Transcript_41797/g.75250  ORF Transcript_41797/g.75250 Transcript_41797/m.75250 type:complete len:182 (+) Transcript_41797:77-622(+)|eukprot:CAMPEP_0201882426 /NCGR_PEP_ID=MMETSP0902-20130614/13851_1 /ASSEMBLY_ACC=CAM_ASM_000551 /TAXON_ID=420261 /ORGANISM="Thalassiosira antarctica, Strain CCMP982" /LENGTH=181 /DNA_ID=CAMNT_0048410941 /DNA_START=64 /DNA_END=609 /DNA_ORIENTATION=+
MTTKNNSSGVMVSGVAMTAPDIESQQKQPTTANPSVYANRDDDAGKGMGIAMVVLLLIGFIFTFILPIVSFVCVIATIIIASILTCGCCCASDYNLKPNAKRFATATLVSLCLMFIVQIIWLIAAAAAMSTEASNTGTISQSTVDGASAGLIAVGALSIVFNIMAIIFSALFTWGRGCGAS